MILEKLLKSSLWDIERPYLSNLSIESFKIY